MTELVAGRDLWRSPGPFPVTWSWMANTGQCSCGTAQPAPESFKDGGFTPSCPDASPGVTGPQIFRDSSYAALSPYINEVILKTA